ncbi:malonyl-ACP O-methyltransferase BioC [Marinicella sediminis]|uniref:Malonyl-[acyl-carrier protein] O-methyltransferase n=1 Tax=Marinicella sediminis TaxID=1792834 RepID=A0ABV7JEG8_9GAMM|nr:malonyl-ACP O-methyltransferase BioC [Marinicella sediminis]
MSLEHHLIQASFDQAADQYEQHAVLQKESLLRLLERLGDDLKTAPGQILDLGCGTGWAVPELLRMYPESQLIAADFAPSMVAKVPEHPQVTTRVTDAHAIDVHAQSCDLVFSNLMMQWCDESTVLQEIKRALKPGGIVHLTTMGEHTLHELKHAWAGIDDKPHVNQFVPAAQIADLAMRLGFEDVIADSEFITMTYANVVDVMRDLKNIGAHNVDHNRHKGLMSAKVIKQLTQNYAEFRSEDGLFPATYELVYLRARKPADDKGLPLKIKS